MTKLMKLSLVAMLASTLALVGCGDSSGGGGDGGSAGAGGTAGSGGSGTGGDGGMGGAGGECTTDCGIENEFPDGSEVSSANLDCSVMGIPVPLSFNFTALAESFVVSGDMDVTVAAQTVIPASVVDLIINLASDATIISTQGDVVVVGGTPVDIAIGLSPVPCLVCFVSGVEVVVNLDVTEETITTDDSGTLLLTLETVTVTIDAAGLELILSNTGDDPACAWNDETPPPSIELSAPQ